jgi:hypothetical protein
MRINTLCLISQFQTRLTLTSYMHVPQIYQMFHLIFGLSSVLFQDVSTTKILYSLPHLFNSNNIYI